jgi:hypothetical protein
MGTVTCTVTNGYFGPLSMLIALPSAICCMLSCAS